MSPGTHIKLLLNRLCIRTQTEEKEHSQTPTNPHCPPPSLPPPPLPLSPRLCSVLGGGVKEEGRQWRCGWEHTQCPVPHCFQMKWHSLCLPCTGFASLMSCPSPQTASDPCVPSSHCAASAHTVQERLSEPRRVLDPLFLKANALDSCTVDDQATGSCRRCKALPVALPPHYCCTDVCPVMHGSELPD